MKNITFLPLKGFELAFMPLKTTVLKKGFEEFQSETLIVVAIAVWARN
jgi:hypothetical protein